MAAQSNRQKSQGLPDHVVGLLSAADKRNGLPSGTMYSIMQQEVGGQADRFIADPAAYHYAANDKGQRIAAHTGKISTAFGPFGILESTAKDPGFGVAPLKDKSIEEQIRFSSDYLAARSQKGGLTAGLAGYGEGGKYAAQVSSRIAGAGGKLPVQAITAAPAIVARSAVPSRAVAESSPVMSVPTQDVQVAQAPVAQVDPEQVSPAAPLGPDQWQQWLEQSRLAQEQPVQVADLNYGSRAPEPQLRIPDFMSVIAQGQSRPNLQMLKALEGWA